MLQHVRSMFAAVSLALLASCGGGGPAGEPAPAHVAGGVELTAPGALRQAAQRAAPAIDATALMDWAERAYPEYFPSHRPNIAFDRYVYRYYPETNIYLGLDGQTVVVKNLFSEKIDPVGNIADFACFVYPQNCPVLSGVAAKGLLNGATVSVYNLNGDGSRGGLLASAATAADGSFSVTLAAPPDGPVLVEAAGGTYRSAYDGAVLASQGTISLMLPVVAATGETGLSVNPLTDMATALARSYVAGGRTLAASIETAENWVSWQYGLTRRPSRIIPRFDVTAASTQPDGMHLALVLAALDTLGSRLSPANPDAIFASLSADFSDFAFDGLAYGGRAVTLNGGNLPSGAGTAEFLKAFAVSFSGTGSGLRPAYLDAHFGRGTLVENYQAEIIPVYVAQEIAGYFPARYASPLPKTTSLDTRLTGYTCPAGAPMTFTNGVGSCGAYYYCTGGATLITVNGRESCSDGSIAVYQSATIAPYTAQAIAPYSAQTIETYQAQTVIGQPPAGTPAIFRASAVHLLTAEELAAMAAADYAIGSAYAAKYSSLGTPTALQLEWMGRINDAVMASVRY